MHKDFGYYLRPSAHNSSTCTDENSMIKVPERMNHSMQILHEKKDYDNVNQSTFIKRPDMLIRVDLSKRNLKEIPDLFLRKEIQTQMQQSGSRRNSFTKEDSPYALLEIDLSENKLTTMSLSPLLGKSLLTLNLSRNRLIDLSVLQYLTKLRELHLAYNYIESSQFDYLNYLKSLEIIDISHNHLKEQRIIDIIENMSKLRIFINNMNDYSRIVFTKKSPTLQQIYLEGNSLSTLEFHKPKPALGILSIKGNHLVEIVGLKNLENLEHINCNHNSLVNLAWLRNSSNIKIINAESNELHSFTPNQLPFIEILNLSNNKLQTMDFMAYCPHLKSLIFSGNKLECLPRFNNIFPSLIFLDLSRNSIREIFGLERFPNLLELNLSQNKLSNLDQLLPELIKLKNLRSLDLRLNKFNANLNFNELLPNASSLKSLELIEQMITPVQEDVFLQFVAYRTIIISNLNRSLTMLDHVEITKYEISMIQEMANKEEEEAPNGGQLLTFHEHPSFTHHNPQNQSQYDDFKMPHNFFRANAHCPSPIKKVADEDYFSVPANSQSFILKKSNNSPFVHNKNNSFVEQDSFVYQRNQPMFQNVEIHRPPAPTKSYPYVDQNSSAVFASEQQNKGEARSFKNMGTPSTISKAPIELESMYKRSFPTNDSNKHSYYTPERTNLNNLCKTKISSYFFSLPIVNQDSRAKFTGLGISGLKTFDSVAVLENTDEEEIEQQQQQVVDQKDWKKVIDDIAVSQKMVENLVQSSCKMGISLEEPIVTEKYSEIKKTKEYQSVPVPPLKKKIDQNDSLAIVDMLAEEMTKEYQENFEKIKNKFKNTLKQQLGVKDERPKITNKDENTTTTVHNTKQPNKITKDRIPPLKSPSSGSINRDRHQSVESSSNRKSQKLKSMESVNRRLDSLESTNRNRARLQSLESTNRSRRNKTVDKENNTQKPYEIEQDTNKQLIEKEAMKLFEAFKSLLEEKLHQQTSQPQPQPIVENPVTKIPVHRNSIPSDHIVVTDQSYEAQSQKNPNPKTSPFVSQSQVENDHQDTNDLTSVESAHRRKPQSSHKEIKTKTSQPSERDSIQPKEERKRNKSSQDQQEHTLPENLITKSSKSNTREIHHCNNTQENSEPLDSLNNRDKFMDRAIIDYQNIHQEEGEEEENLPVDPQEEEEEDLSETILGLALSLYKNRLPQNSIFIDSIHLKSIFSELLQTLRIEYSPDDVQELVATISDFVPKKLTEQGFIDLFSLNEVSDFLIRNNIFEHSQTARFTESFLNNNPRPTEEQGYEIQDEQPSITLETLSLIQSQNRTQQTKAGITENERSASDFYYNSGPSPSPHKQTGMHKHFQSLSPSETTWQRTVTGQSELPDYRIIKSPDFYGHQMSDFIIQLMPYSKTPPRPVFNKETNQSILKEIQSNSTEYELVSAVLGTLGFELSRVVKTYNHKQHKKLEKLLEDNCLLKTLEYQFGNMGSKGRMLRELQKNNSLAVRNDRTIQFYDKVVMFHSAKPKDLSELIEHPNGFKDVYKNKPGHLLFSQKGHICLKQYQSFMKRHYRNELNTEDQNTSLIHGKNEKPKWRVLVSHVFLGSCYVEKEMNFRSFMYEGEEKVVELLREGYSSIYFERDDAYLVLLSEQCVPIYLCEFSFENMRGTEGNTLFYTTSC